MKSKTDNKSCIDILLDMKSDVDNLIESFNRNIKRQ